VKGSRDSEAPTELESAAHPVTMDDDGEGGGREPAQAAHANIRGRCATKLGCVEVYHRRVMKWEPALLLNSDVTGTDISVELTVRVMR